MRPFSKTSRPTKTILLVGSDVTEREGENKNYYFELYLLIYRTGNGHNNNLLKTQYNNPGDYLLYALTVIISYMQNYRSVTSKSCNYTKISKMRF